MMALLLFDTAPATATAIIAQRGQTLQHTLRYLFHLLPLRHPSPPCR
jgi:hypothetical protein